MTTREEVRRMTCEQRLVATEFAVEATSFEQLALWQEWAREAESQRQRVREHHPRIQWKEISDGWLPTIGHVADRPTCVSLTWAVLDGRLVLFYYGTSQLVDHKLIEEWVRASMPQLFPAEGRSRTTDAMNFHIAAHWLRDANAPAGVRVSFSPSADEPSQ